MRASSLSRHCAISAYSGPPSTIWNGWPRVRTRPPLTCVRARTPGSFDSSACSVGGDIGGG